MIIRKAVLDDIDGIIKLINKFHQESLEVYGFKIDNDYIKKTISTVIQEHIGFVAEDNGELVGMMGMLLIPSLFDGSLTAQEIVWYMGKSYREGFTSIKLMNAMEKECINRGAKAIVLAAMDNSLPFKLDSYYHKKGYNILERQYIKQIGG